MAPGLVLTSEDRHRINWHRFKFVRFIYGLIGTKFPSVLSPITDATANSLE